VVLRPRAGGVTASGGAVGGNLPVVWTRPPAGAELGATALRPSAVRPRGQRRGGGKNLGRGLAWRIPRASSVGRLGAKAVVGHSSLCSCDSVSAIKPYEGFGDVDHTIKELMSL
jgi:hypothetical protein